MTLRLLTPLAPQFCRLKFWFILWCLSPAEMWNQAQIRDQEEVEPSPHKRVFWSKTKEESFSSITRWLGPNPLHFYLFGISSPVVSLSTGGVEQSCLSPHVVGKYDVGVHCVN